MLPFALAMRALPYVGRSINGCFTSSELLSLGLTLVAIGDAVTGWGAHVGVSMTTMCGMVTLGSGGGLLNGETQKAIMSAVRRQRAGKASGISTTSRFAGILLGFAALSGVIGTVARSYLIHTSCLGGRPCAYAISFVDAVVAGDLPRALAGLTDAQRDIAIMHARPAYAEAFGTALFTAAVLAAVSALSVLLLMSGRTTERKRADS